MIEDIIRKKEVLKLITCLYSSSRNEGNSYLAMKYLLEGVNYKFINLYMSDIDKVIDNRHTINQLNHYDDYDAIVETVRKSETIIFSTPLYWYSMSSSLKLFIDRWSETLRDNKVKDFKKEMSQKRFIVVIIGGDSPMIKSQPLINQFKYIFEFMNISNYEFIVGEGNRPKDILKDKDFINRLIEVNKSLK